MGAVGSFFVITTPGHAPPTVLGGGTRSGDVAPRQLVGRVGSPLLLAFLSLVVLFAAPCRAVVAGDPREGYRLLTEKVYLPPDFDQETLEATWNCWPEPLRSEAAQASRARRREMILDRYGLSLRPGASLDDDQLQPLQYAVSSAGEWSMNCFACHGGRVYDQVTPGAPNAEFALEILTAEIRKTKLRLGKPLGTMDVGSMFMPLGKTRGTTNAVMFGVALLASREKDLSLKPNRIPPPMTHHDMDAPPWWNFHSKQMLYIDGFAPTGHRPLMQFMLVEQNGPEEFASWETDFQHVLAYIRSLRPPRYPHATDAALVGAGQAVFEANCASCHGTYGERPEFPEKLVPLEEVGTDPVRLKALTVQDRERYASSWFAEGHRDRVTRAPDGYVAPPLHGIWASAPYLHNGSVPTLWHLLNPEQRPSQWRRIGRAFDAERVGFVIETGPPAEKALDPAIRHAWFDSTRFGKSNSGHLFPAPLSVPQKKALLEYLKTL